MFNFRSKITQKLLQYYFLNPNRRHYVNELADMLEVDPGNLHRKLKELEREGVFISSIAGREHYYGLNKNYPLLKEIKRVHEIEYGLAGMIKSKLAGLKGLEEAYLFGSYAKGGFGQDSDIDLLLVGKHAAIEARRMILPLKNSIGREINIIDLTPRELSARRQQKDEFIKNIFSGPIIKLI